MILSQKDPHDTYYYIITIGIVYSHATFIYWF